MRLGDTARYALSAIGLLALVALVVVLYLMVNAEMAHRHDNCVRHADDPFAQCTSP